MKWPKASAIRYTSRATAFKPAAEKFGLALRQSGWIGKERGQAPYFTNGRLLQAIFSEDAIKNKRNTEAVEVAPNTLVSARVLDHRPASTLPPIAELKDKITALVARQEAAERRCEGRQGKACAVAGEQGNRIVSWGATQQISRREPQGLDNENAASGFQG